MRLQWPLSYSSLSMYLRCPLKFKLHYVDKLREAPRSQWSFGSTLHRSIEYFHQYTPPPAPLEKVLRFYRENWESAGYASAEAEREHRDLGEQVLARFVELHGKEHFIRVGAEVPFRIEIDEVPFQGKIDEVRRMQDGDLEVLDYKSLSEGYDSADVRDSLQLTAYQVGVEATLGKVGRLSIYNLRAQETVSVPPRSAAEIAQFKALVKATSDAILADRYPPREEEDCPCEFAEHCPLYRDMFARRGQMNLLESTLERDGKELVAEYVKARDGNDATSIHQTEDRMQEYARAREVSRIFGATDVVTLTPLDGGGTAWSVEPRAGRLARQPPQMAPPTRSGRSSTR